MAQANLRYFGLPPSPPLIGARLRPPQGTRPALQELLEALGTSEYNAGPDQRPSAGFFRNPSLPIRRVTSTLTPPAVQVAATRDAYGVALAELGKDNPEIIVLDADLSGSTRTKTFAQAFPKRFFNMGVAESNMMGTAAGLAAMGKVVFASSFAMFAAGKAWEPIRQTVCIPNLNVKICATHAGLTVGEDGKSHQMLEDLALMQVLPNMTVIVPADSIEAKLAIRAVAAHDGPVYVRLSRAKTPVIFDEDYVFKIGRGTQVRAGNDLALVACGVELSAALEAAEILAAEGVNARVINMATIKPLDKDILVAAARDCGAVLTAEEHQAIGGMGNAVSQLLAHHAPVPIEVVGVRDSFGESATADQLLEKYGLDAQSIASRSRDLLRRKNA